ncbi:hypothetical protein GEV33_015573 [Tenebrio molitor]|uniref:Uncharacterized protein n=1 Tax=Tenebrio molitor TaxID=7067 RepID=A0A8J6L5K0_TENMO|nr:hypothetical protein GEV33_015573 [Tenebrio molitor]
MPKWKAGTKLEPAVEEIVHHSFLIVRRIRHDYLKDKKLKLFHSLEQEYLAIFRAKNIHSTFVQSVDSIDGIKVVCSFTQPLEYLFCKEQSNLVPSLLILYLDCFADKSSFLSKILFEVDQEFWPSPSRP